MKAEAGIDLFDKIGTKHKELSRVNSILRSFIYDVDPTVPLENNTKTLMTAVFSTYDPL
jgi:hypothetical protein